jgi:hypothetical protein
LSGISECTEPEAATPLRMRFLEKLDDEWILSLALDETISYDIIIFESET